MQIKIDIDKLENVPANLRNLKRILKDNLNVDKL